MNRAHILNYLILLVLLADAAGRDYKPVKCKNAVPYEGKPVYANEIDLTTAAFQSDQVLESETSQHLEKALEEAANLTRANIISAAVLLTRGRWSSSRSNDGSLSHKRMYWASVGKAFTATIILQMVQEQKLFLDQPISRWFDHVPNAASITIDHLLQHTSGLFSHNEDLNFRKNPRYYSPLECIGLSARHGAMFCPGQYWRYSNTGYTLLGQVIEKTDQLPYHQAVKARIIDRLPTSTLQALAPQELPDDVAAITPSDRSLYTMEPSWGYSAGCVVGTAMDMVLFWQALLSAQLLDRTNTARLFERMYPMFDNGTYYGRGVMLYVLPDQEQEERIWLGHSGGTAGAKAVVAFSPADRAFVAVALSGDGSAEAVANLLLKRIRSPEN